MKKLLKLSFAVVTAVLAIGSANAQMVTLETVSSYELSIQSFNRNQTLTQTFTNVVGVDSMTYRFVSSGTATAGTNLTAYFYEWDATTNRTIGSALWTLSGQSIPLASGGAWQTFSTEVEGEAVNYIGYDYTLSLGAAGVNLNPNATYAMILQSLGTTSGGANTFIGLQNIPDTDKDAFTWGVALRQSGISNIDLLSSTSSSYLSGNSDYGFQQITITPVPEPATAAACFAALFVAGLVGRRLYQRRQQAAVAQVPVAA